MITIRFPVVFSLPEPVDDERRIHTEQYGSVPAPEPVSMKRTSTAPERLSPDLSTAGKSESVGVNVVCRFRPLNEREQQTQSTRPFEISGASDTVA